MLTFRKTLEQLGIKSQKMFEKRKCYECRQALPEEEVTITAIDIRKFLSMIPPRQLADVLLIARAVFNQHREKHMNTVCGLGKFLHEFEMDGIKSPKPPPSKKRIPKEETLDNK